MTNFDKLIKEKRELVLDILSNGMCFDEDGEIIAYKDDTEHACMICKFRHAENCEEEVKKWLCEEVDGQDEKEVDK